MIPATATEVRALIAAHLCGSSPAPPSLGEIVLLPHQIEAVERTRRLLEARGGAVLADDVGLGKTFVALAMARERSPALVIAPAALRATWQDAARRADVEVEFLSVEALSRGATAGMRPGLVIIDEAHHLRSTQTKRYHSARVICGTAPVLALTATPVQNSLDDLRSIVALFAGTGAQAMTESEVAAVIVRRTVRDVQSHHVSLPRVESPRWLPHVSDVNCLDRLLALPRAVPPADGDDGGVLLSYTLLRQWTSSRAALRGALRRRLARAFALEDSLAAGRLPTRRELSAWTFADGAQQLAFPELATTSLASDAGALLVQVRAHASAVRALLEWLDSSPNPDIERAFALRTLLTTHPGQRVIAFSEYAETVSALYELLVRDTRVAMLTHGGGQVASGALSRADILKRFGPGASTRTPERERIDLLLTTDVLSEGVNLQDASVVVHLDLSWNPARLEQRVGRLRRLGAARDSISVYLSRPPAPAERMLQLEQRLRFKIGAAARTLGVAGAILPGVFDAPVSATQQQEQVTSLLRSWLSQNAPACDDPRAAGVHATLDGALACVRFGDQAVLVGICEGRVTDSRDDLERLLVAASGSDTHAEPARVSAARQSIERWLRRRIVSDVVDLPALRVARSRRALLRRVDTISRRAARHCQPRLAPLMHAARAAATAVLSSGAELVLEELTRSVMPDEAWLHAVGEFAALHARSRSTGSARVLALLLLVREPGA